VAVASAKLIQEMGRLDQCFLACTVEQGREAKAVVPEIRVCNMSRQGGDRWAYVNLTIDEGCAFIQLHQNNKLEDLEAAVAKLHKNGVTVNYYGANDPDRIAALHAAGVDYILTDKLDLCLKTLHTASNR
jgi:glycerophosphoryl diester phosphodiesterase